MPDDEMVNKLLGFANRARRLTLGMHATLSGIQKKKICLVLLAKDLGKNSESKIIHETPNVVPVYRFSSKEQLSRLFGRKDIGIVGIADQSFATPIKKILTDIESNLPE